MGYKSIDTLFNPDQDIENKERVENTDIFNLRKEQVFSSHVHNLNTGRKISPIKNTYANVVKYAP